MKIFLLLIFFFSSIILTGQSRWERAAFVNRSPNMEPLDDTQKEKYRGYIFKDHQNLKACSTKKCKAMKYIRMASMHYLIDNPLDSVSNNLNLFIQLDTARGCRLLTKFAKSRELHNPAYPRSPFFAKEFSKEWWDHFSSYCTPILDTMNLSKSFSKKETPIISNLEYAEQLKTMAIKDQQFRKKLMKNEINEVLWKKQNANDLENRSQLDFLRKKYGYPTPDKVGKDGLHSVWLILQHSTDCDWNEKWIQLHIDHFLTGELPSEGMVPFSMSRFFSPENGFCPEEQRRKFIQHLKKKYSDEVAYKYGYKDF